MQRTLLLCTLIYCFVSSTIAGGGGGGGGDVDDSDVIVGTSANFDEIINHDLALVEFYAPWCGHCKKLTPEFGQAATVLLKNDPPVHLAKVDATIESALASKYKVSGYPTLFLFRNGRESPYNGPREAKGIIDYMKKQVGPSAKPLLTSDDLESFTAMTSERDYCIVGFFDPNNAKSSQLHAAFLLVSSKMRDDYFFGIVTDKEVAKKAGFEGESLVAFKNYDDLKTLYSGPTKKKEVEDWIVQNSLPIVGEFTSDKGERYHKRGLPIAKFYMHLDWSPANLKHTQFYTSRLEKVALEFRDKILTTVANSSSFGQALEDLGWKGKNNVLAIESGRQRFKFEKEFKPANVRKFYVDFLAGSLTSYIKSETAPATNDGPVKVLVGSNFQEIVSPDKDVLIEFYAPWCGHCKQLEPKYKKLGEKFKGVDSVVIAKMDATANDYPPEYEVSGFPTIFLKPSGKNSKPVKFEGGQREVTDFVDFIKKNAKTPWSFAKKRKGRSE